MEESSETEDNERNKDSGGKWRGEFLRARHRPLANTRGVAGILTPASQSSALQQIFANFVSFRLKSPKLLLDSRQLAPAAPKPRRRWVIRGQKNLRNGNQNGD
jgi:hypothetical protein